ncbi:hypothetical protein [Paraburkholderia bannensis]|uniref:hypothetical protein n=1 Tax=Paraburkholderia bannensis TaxID=765414 RepID=UPI002AAFE5FC|nr:hypothetical protein [Paraburkholderia bannensis]
MVALLRNDPFIDKRQRLMARRTYAKESAIDVPPMGQSPGGNGMEKGAKKNKGPHCAGLPAGTGDISQSCEA